jgi:DNA-binding SARP family transcriptional activator
VSRLRFDEEALGWEFYNVGLLLAGREDADVPHALKYVEEVLTQEVLREQELDLLHIGLHTIQMLAPRYPEVAELHKRLFPKIQERIGRTLELLASERAFAFMTALLDRWSDYFPAREMKRWRARAAAVRASWEADHPRSADKRSIRVSMFGRIEIAHGDEEPRATRGSRLRTLLGLMVANQVLDHPLTLEEFCAIAESELDFERSKNNLHVGIHRLREAVGHDAVLTDQRTPRLNPEIVRVDLIEAHSLLGEANTALRTGHLIRAWSALRNALEITGGEVPYPTLYDGFFEAARQDFELLLRETTIAVARAFLLEEDASSAAKVLRLAIASAPGDDELSELLADALIRSGKRAEARRVKIGADT